MPGRQAHGAPPSKKPKVRVNNKKRSINAFAIAAQQNPEKLKIRQHRLGHVEGDDRPRKRVRTDVDSGDGEDGSSIKRSRKDNAKDRFDELDIEKGSDSEGNEWQMGQVDSDDDSDLDSDEAFGESDEERFEGFAFTGSTNNGKDGRRGKNVSSKDITLEEKGDDSDIPAGSEDDDLGEDAIDLADMLDESDEKHAEETNVSKSSWDKGGEGSSEGESYSESEDSGGDSSISSMEDDNDEESRERLSALQSLVANLPQAELAKAPSRQRSDGANEYSTPSDFGVTSKTKLTLEDLGLPSVRDPFVKKSLRLLALESKTDAKRNGVSGKLEVPLAKRQQDRLDRSVAYEKSKETLNRWTDTVKHNRRAEHLIFPLPDADAASANSNVRLQPTTTSKPFNELEATIQSILEESGLAAANGKDDEDRLMEMEELETNKMSVEEVKARRVQLRMARDLLFREEVRAKRIKKIKSRSYRRVHRKAREREERKNREALAEAGIEPSEDEQDLQDRRRAEARMGARHRNSKWAKATKQVGRAAWDEDARNGITDLARRDEELRKRIEGRTTRNDDDGQEPEMSVSQSDDDDDGSLGDGTTDSRLLQKLKGVGNSDVFASSQPGSKLSSMKFMLKAEASRKKENDAKIEEIRREIAGEDLSENEGEVEGTGDVGRRIFGPGTKPIEDYTARPPNTGEFEERDDSDSDDTAIIRLAPREENVPSRTPRPIDRKLNIETQKSNDTKGPSSGYTTSSIANIGSEGGAWSRIVSRKDESEVQRRKQKHTAAVDVEELDLTSTMVLVKKAKLKKKVKDRQSTLHVDNSDEEISNDDETDRLPFAIRDQELIKRAFAGADVVGEFEAEKRQTVQDEDDKVIDNTLPGWGSWVGEGVSKKEQRQSKGRFLTKVEGVKEQDRKDAKLDRVIINEKRVKKNGKYLASSLPHPFETRQQYERSLRLPVGPEWTTKETFQDATKPRILMKQGIIAPMSKPLL